MYLLHIQAEGPQWVYIFPLVVDNISLICWWTTGPHRDPLCPVASYGLSVLFKDTEGNPYVSLINSVFDGMSFIFNLLYCFFTWPLDFPFIVGVRLIYLFTFLIFISFFLILNIGEIFLGLVLGAMDFPFWVNYGWIISLHCMKGLHCWSALLIPTKPPSLLLNIFIL